MTVCSRGFLGEQQQNKSDNFSVSQSFPVKAQGIVFRGLGAPKCVSAGRVTQRAFERREPKPGKRGDPTGISVNPTPTHAIAYLKEPVGIASLSCGDVRELKNPFDGLSLDVEWNKERHGNILNVPFYRTDLPDDRQQLLEDFLYDLATIASLESEKVFDQALKEKKKSGYAR